LLAEHDLPTGQQVIGCCLDGTGYGTDGAIWGGEWMVANQVTFERFAHLKYIPLPGGDASIRRPYRVAMAQLWAGGASWDRDLPCLKACPPAERTLLGQQLEKNLNCVPTSSMGRLFDAIASLVGLRQTVNYEAQAAMELEAIAARVVGDVDPGTYEFSIQQTGRIEIDSSRMIQQICGDIKSGTERGVIAARFHHAVANMISNVCQMARDRYRINTVGLTGGVFQNVLLLRLTRQQLVALGFDVLTHTVVPPNDGGLALGQAVVARNILPPFVPAWSGKQGDS
jgi:hydrogenase maturation protein HypF